MEVKTLLHLGRGWDTGWQRAAEGRKARRCVPGEALRVCGTHAEGWGSKEAACSGRPGWEGWPEVAPEVGQG